MKSWKFKFTLCSIVVLLLAAIILAAFHPIWWLPEQSVKSWILHKVPVGSNIDHLKTIAKDEGWKINGIWSGDLPHADWGGISGAQIAWIDLGGRWRVFREDFDSFWAFDAEGKLIDVRVRHMVDAL